jgi:hypothetical protein
MATLLFIVIAFIYLSIIWVAVLAVYNVFVEPFDFGPLSLFAAKSVALVLTVALFVTFVPFGGLASLIIWWIGLMVIFKKDFWECKILVILIWGISFLGNMGIQALLLLYFGSHPANAGP